ncbi:hypothetical protein CQ018_08315 [Arthrobacter sp. MYb227]|nr:hypothetical protein CQ018_08315 [Arthrobacter sp. MYb227]
MHTLVVKGTQPKTGIWKFTLAERPRDYCSPVMPEDFTEMVGYQVIGASEVFLVQEWIPMVDEYQLFMAGLVQLQVPVASSTTHRWITTDKPLTPRSVAIVVASQFARTKIV